MAYNVNIPIILHKNQGEIHQSSARFKVIKAGKRFGKTQWALYELIRMAFKKEEGGVWWYIAPTRGQAKDIAWRTLLNWIPRNLYKKLPTETDLTFHLLGDKYITLKGAENDEALRGPELDGLILDEASYMNEYIWPNILMGQISKSEGSTYFISSPNRTGRNWYTGFCDDAKRKSLLGDKEWGYWHFTIYDNPTLKREEIQRIKDACSDDSWNLEYMAIESAYAGVRFSEFDYSRHCEVIVVNEGMRCFRGLDWGIGHPTVCLWVYVDERKNLIYIDDEFVRSGSLIRESCQTIKEKTGNRNVELNVIDPSTRKRNSQTERSDADEFARYGIPCMLGDNSDRGYDIVKMFLKRDMVKINPSCRNLINELRNLQYGDKVGDDATDALRYVLVYIHDLIFRDLSEAPEVLNEKKPDLSFYDKRLFPDRGRDRNDDLQWMVEEVS